MSRNNYFEVDVENQKNKYWIFKELQEKQAVVIKDVSKKDWWQSISREIGIESKSIVLNGEKVIHGPVTNRYQNEAYIIKGDGINFEEIKKGMKSRFIPKKINEK
jgi:hypothetical protein